MDMYRDEQFLPKLHVEKGERLYIYLIVREHRVGQCWEQGAEDSRSGGNR